MIEVKRDESANPRQRGPSDRCRYRLRRWRLKRYRDVAAFLLMHTSVGLIGVEPVVMVLKPASARQAKHVALASISG